MKPRYRYMEISGLCAWWHVEDWERSATRPGSAVRFIPCGLSRAQRVLQRFGLHP